MSLRPTFQQENVLILSVSNLILRFIVGNPSWSCSKAFPPFRGIEVVRLHGWWPKSPRFVLAIRGSCFMWKERGPLNRALKLTSGCMWKTLPFLLGHWTMCKQICWGTKRSSDLKPVFPSLFLSFSLSETKQDRRQTGDNLSNICCLSLVSWPRTISFQKVLTCMRKGGKGFTKEASGHVSQHTRLVPFIGCLSEFFWWTKASPSPFPSSLPFLVKLCENKSWANYKVQVGSTALQNC